MAKTTTDLLTAVRRAAFLPDASDQSDTDLLAFADQELETLVSEAVVSGRGEHWYKTEDTTITAGTTSYRLPRRVLGRAIRAVTVVPPQTTVPEYELTQVDPMVLRGMFTSTSVANPAYFAFEGDFIKLGAVPATSDWTLRVHYVCRPSKLVATGGYTTMSRIAAAPTTTTLTLYDTTTFASVGKYTLFDIVRGSEPYDPVYLDRFPTSDYSSPGPTMTLDTTTPVVVSDFTISGFSTWNPSISGREGMWLVLRDTTPLPPVPAALWTSLVYSTAAAALAAVRDPGAGQMGTRAVAAKAQAVAMMEPRDERQTQTIISRMSPLRARRWR